MWFLSSVSPDLTRSRKIARKCPSLLTDSGKSGFKRSKSEFPRNENFLSTHDYNSSYDRAKFFLFSSICFFKLVSIRCTTLNFRPFCTDKKFSKKSTDFLWYNLIEWSLKVSNAFFHFENYYKLMILILRGFIYLYTS